MTTISTTKNISEVNDFTVGGNKRSDLFPLSVVQAAHASEISTGCPAAITLAQYALESGFGKYDLGTHNYFGIKWFNGCHYGFVERATKEFSKHSYVTVMARFIAFPTAEECFDFHANLLMKSPAYGAAVPYARKDWMKFAQRIAPIYATDPEYFTKLVELIETWKLYEFGTVPPYPGALPS